MPAAADGELQPIETDAVQIGDAAECGEHDVRGQCSPPRSCTSTCENPSKRAPVDFGAAPIPAAHGLKGREKSAAQRRVEKSQRLRRLVEQRDGAAERGENGGVLAGDHAAAQHHHGARYVRQAQDGVAVENVFVIHLDGRHMPRPRSGGEQHPRRAQHDPRSVQALHLDAIRIQKHAAAADQLDLVARELRLQISVLSGDDDVDAVKQRGQRRIAAQLDGQRRCAALHAAIAQRLLAQRLARNRARQQAGAADLRFALDDGGAKSRLGRLNRRFLAGRPGPHADESRSSRGCTLDARQAAHVVALREHAPPIVRETRRAARTPGSRSPLPRPAAADAGCGWPADAPRAPCRPDRCASIRGSCANRSPHPAHPWAAASCSSTDGRRRVRIRRRDRRRCARPSPCAAPISKRDRIFSASAAPVRCISAARKALSTCLRRSRAISLAHRPASHASRHSSSDSGSWPGATNTSPRSITAMAMLRTSATPSQETACCSETMARARTQRRRIRDPHDLARQRRIGLNQARQLRRIGRLLRRELGELRAHARQRRDGLRTASGVGSGTRAPPGSSGRREQQRIRDSLDHPYIARRPS